MNILQIQDDLKNFSEEQLVNEMRRPSGTAPQYLVLSEMNRRQRVKSDYQAAQASDPSTVAEEAVASAGVPASGIMGMAQAMAPKSESSLSAPKPPAMMMREGGVVNAQQGTYFPSTPELYGIYGQESGFGKNLMGSSGEVGPYQIMPTTALMPGYGMLKLFPEISAQIGKGKKYETAEQAYADNKEKIDSVLMSGEKTEPFVKSYLDTAQKNLGGDRNLALLAYNQGIGGTKGFKGNPLDTDYVSGVKSNIPMYDERAIKPNLLTQMMTSTGEAATKDQKKDEPNFFEKYILGEKFGGTGANPFYDLILGDKGKAIADEYVENIQKQNIEDEQEKMGSEIPKSVLDKVTAEEKKFLTTTPLFSAPTIEFDKDDPANISEERSTGDPVDDAASLYAQDKKDAEEAAAKKKAADAAKTPTLDEQLVAMQKDLAKSREQDKYLALAQAGLAIMASDKPTLGQAIGEGAGVGLQAYRDAQERYQEGVIDLLNARAKLAKNKTTFSRKDALAAINSYNTQITKLLSDREGVFNEGDKEKINQKIRNLEFQKSQLLPFAGIIGRETTTKAEYMGA